MAQKNFDVGSNWLILLLIIKINEVEKKMAQFSKCLTGPVLIWLLRISLTVEETNRLLSCHLIFKKFSSKSTSNYAEVETHGVTEIELKENFYVLKVQQKFGKC